MAKTPDNDLDLNVLKGKKLTNVRTLVPMMLLCDPATSHVPKEMMAYINDDELLLTPNHCGCANAADPHERKSGKRVIQGDKAKTEP